MRPLQHTPSGIPGFDLIANGGFVRNRATLIAGSAGSGKTVFGLQFLVAGATELDENGVMVTFEESADDMSANVDSFDWAITRLL